MTRYSLAAGRSSARCAASFIAIRWSSDATRTSTPKSVVSTPLARSASYFGHQPRRGCRGPNSCRTRFEPFAIDTASSTKGTLVGGTGASLGAPGAQGEAFDALLARRTRRRVVGRIPRPVSESGEPPMTTVSTPCFSSTEMGPDRAQRRSYAGVRGNELRPRSPGGYDPRPGVRGSGERASGRDPSRPRARRGRAPRSSAAGARRGSRRRGRRGRARCARRRLGGACADGELLGSGRGGGGSSGGARPLSYPEDIRSDTFMRVLNSARTQGGDRHMLMHAHVGEAAPDSARRGRWKRLSAHAAERNLSVGAVVREALDRAIPASHDERRGAARRILSAEPMMRRGPVRSGESSTRFAPVA